MKRIIPTYFHEINNYIFVYYLFHALVLWIVPALVSYYILISVELLLIFKILIIFCLTIFSGFGFFLLAVLGHEGFHGSLHNNRFFSLVIGTLSSSFVPLFMSYGYNVIHWDHHKYTNTLKDPDYKMYSKFNNVFTRCIFGPFLVINRCYFINLKTVFCFNFPQKVFPFSNFKIYIIALVNLILFVVNVSICFIIYSYNVHLFLLLIFFPLLFTQFLWGIAPFLEHAKTGKDELNNTRTCTSIILRLLLIGYNFHIGHHLYPRVQLHKLPKLHLYLTDNNYLNEENIVKSTVKYLKIGIAEKMD